MRPKNRLLALCAALFFFLPFTFTGAQAADDVTLDELAEVMPELREAMDSVRLRKNPQYLNNSVIEGKRLPRLLLRNVTLKGGEFKECALPELRLENVTFENFRFDNTVIGNAEFKNVNFKNCLFVDSILADSRLADCVFSGGELRRSRYNAHGGRGNFEKTTFERVVFDGNQFKEKFFLGTAEGSISFRNLRIDEGSLSEGRFFLQGYGLQLEFERCEVGKLDFLSVWRGGKVTIKDSRFRGSRFWSGTNTEYSFERCVFSGDTSLDIEGTVPLLNCTAKNGVSKGHKTQLEIRGGEVADTGGAS